MQIFRFKHNTAFFSALVIATGGCYPALAVVSSNMFGHPLTSSGLTRYELSKLSKMRIWNTVLLENVPQLFLQILYTAEIDEIEEYVLIAFLASILSVFVSTLSYLIGRDANGMIAVEYHLAVQCTRGPKPQSPVQAPLVIKPYRKLPSASPKSTCEATILQTKPATNELAANQITDREEADIVANSGRRLRLARALSALYDIQPKALEIGATLCTKHGATTHCVQFVDETGLKAMRDELADANHGVTDISAERYVDRLYESVKDEIVEAVRSHFNLSSDFEVKLDQNGDKRGRNAGDTQARLRLALKDFLEDNNEYRCDVIEARAQNLMEAFEGKAVDDTNENEFDRGGDDALQPAELQMVSMGACTEDPEDALCEAGAKKDDDPSSEELSASHSAAVDSEEERDEDEKAEFEVAYVPTANNDASEQGGADEQRRQERSHSVRARCRDEDCDYQHVDTLESERLDLLYKSISPTDQQHFRTFHSWS